MISTPELNEVERRYAGVVLLSESGKIIGQKRDDKPGIDDPGKVGTFGGAVETGETPKRAAWRELTQEETNLQIDYDSLMPLHQEVARRKRTGEWEARYYYLAHVRDEALPKLKVYEGQGWTYINGHSDPALIDQWRPAIKQAEQHIS